MSRREAAAEVLAMVGITRDRPAEPATPSLPIADTRLFTLTEPELYDLIHHATTRYLNSLANMTRARAHTHAERIASLAVVSALASDAAHLGTDPRG